MLAAGRRPPTSTCPARRCWVSLDAVASSGWYLRSRRRTLDCGRASGTTLCTAGWHMIRGTSEISQGTTSGRRPRGVLSRMHIKRFLLLPLGGVMLPSTPQQGAGSTMPRLRRRRGRNLKGRSRLVFGRRHQPPPERARPGRTTARGPRSLLRAARGRLPALQKVGHPLPRARASATAPATAASEASTRHRLRAAAPPRPRAHAPSSTARRPAPTAPVAAAASMWQRRRSMGATRRRRGRQCLRWVPHRRPRGARFEKPADDDLRTRGDGFGARAAQTDHTSLASASVTTSGLRNRTAAFGQQAAGTTQGQQRSPTLAGSGGSGSTLGQRMEEAQQKVARKAVNGYVSHATGGLVKNVPPSVSNSALSHAKKNPQDAMRFAKFATKAM